MKLLVSALVLGVLVNTILAQIAGWFPMGIGPAAYHYVKVDGSASEVSVTYGFGRCSMTFRSLFGSEAAMWQRVRAGPPVDSRAFRSEPDYAPAGVVPSWCSAWDKDRRALDKLNSANVRSSGGLTSPPLDTGIGVPFISFSASLDPRPLITGVPNPPLVVHGGFMDDPVRAGSYNVRTLAWRPVWPGILYGSLFWASIIWLTLSTASFVRAR